MGNVYIQSHWRSNDGCGFWVGSQFWHGAEQLPAHPSPVYVALNPPGSPLEYGCIFDTRTDVQAFLYSVA